jgi:hypothetical protein
MPPWTGSEHSSGSKATVGKVNSRINLEL